MGKILLFIYDEMADFEITLVTHLLGADMGKEVIPIAYEKECLSSKSGIIYKPKATVKEALQEEVEGLVIPGGWNGEIRPELMELIQKLNSEKKLLAAICAGPRFFAKAGVLKDAKYTTSLAEWTEVQTKQFGESDPFPRENFIMERVVTDRNIITAQGTAFVDFAVAVGEWFNGFKDEAEKDELLKVIRGV
ncbi:DJ-1/PfpI family protein [Clostridium sp. 19966]|uniref:DJ-1/PfpI family protein n=1 Tax=Clostridium sp. 19966 TaxID=2768166 RepID=UPI0028DEC195|nr:DJ-1/PfpI family protein [Clostridium sp. 19966]MDT8716868.1 DJ-1/PfpI family protein [Clostridium sp. 19966]